MSDYAIEQAEMEFAVYMQELEAGFWGEDHSNTEESDVDHV